MNSLQYFETKRFIRECEIALEFISYQHKHLISVSIRELTKDILKYEQDNRGPSIASATELGSFRRNSRKIINARLNKLNIIVNNPIWEFSDEIKGTYILFNRKYDFYKRDDIHRVMADIIKNEIFNEFCTNNNI